MSIVTAPLSRACPKCGGSVERTIVASLVRSVLLPLQRSRWEARKSPLEGETCIECGYTELYAIKPRLFAPQDNSHES